MFQRLSNITHNAHHSSSRTKYPLITLMLLGVLLITACGGSPASAPASTPASTQPNSQSESTTDETNQEAIDTEMFTLDDWESVERSARGQTINWYMWGGSERINNFVDTFYGEALQERYDITLNRVPVADAIDFVNQVLSEKEAGIERGSIDLLWLNGENFASLKQADMLYDGWTRIMPNSKYVNWDNPALNLDFGEPIEELESPWSSAQLQFIYDSARMNEDELPRSFAELKTWACDNPGHFIYPAPGPGSFQGTRFVKGALYEISGDPSLWKKFDQATWDEWSPKLWEYLNELKPCLWREGETYPKDVYEQHALFANQEVDFSITQAIAGAGPLIANGDVPETARAFVFDNYMIGDFNYLAIPVNAPHKAASLVLANMILSPEFQALQIIPENGFGLGYGIDVTLVTEEEDIKALEAAAKQLGDPATPAADLANALAADTDAAYQSVVEQEWRKFVLIGE